jgi:hypothetical protein
VYENADKVPIVNDFCVDAVPGCPAIPGWREVGFFDVKSCEQCVIHPPAGVVMQHTTARVDDDDLRVQASPSRRWLV